MSKTTEAVSAAPQMPVEPPKRLFKVIGELPIRWKHDTPDERMIVPGEVIDFDHLTESEIALLVQLGYIAPSDDQIPSVPPDAPTGRVHTPP